MPAPDLPPPPAHLVKEKPLAVHLLPRMYRAEGFTGCVTIVIDVLRASTTIAAALVAGARAVAPTLSIDEARAVAATPAWKGSLLGGERGGVRIEGFDLGNSPLEYTPQRVNGRAIVFTTTNGTAALLHASRSARVLVGSFANLSEVCDAVAADPHPVHIVCAGTRDEVSLDDGLAAGAMVERLLTAGRHLVADDSALTCLTAWREVARGGGEGLVKALRASRGGRGLVSLGFDRDIVACAAIDSCRVVPLYDPEHGVITALPPAQAAPRA